MTECVCNTFLREGERIKSLIIQMVDIEFFERFYLSGKFTSRMKRKYLDQAFVLKTGIPRGYHFDFIFHQMILIYEKNTLTLIRYFSFFLC